MQTGFPISSEKTEQSKDNFLHDYWLGLSRGCLISAGYVGLPACHKPSTLYCMARPTSALVTHPERPHSEKTGLALESS